MSDVEHALYVIAPLFGGFVVHGLCIRFGWLRRVAVPVDAMKAWRGRRLFGDNKTYRGFVTVGIGTGLGFPARAAWWPVSDPAYPAWMLRLTWASFAFGVALGLLAMAFELPNSFCKRQLGIGPGMQGTRIVGVLFYVVDQVDVLAGVWLAMSIVTPVSALAVLWSCVILFLAHQVLTVVGYALGMRDTWR